jgi:phage repressor protein C with HTH and peptisase S24 domain
MAFGTRAEFDPVREVAFGGISATYAPVGGPLTDHARIVIMSNSGNAEVYISVDGINNNFRLASNSFKLIDFSTNKIRDDGLFVAVGTQFYVKQVSGAVGSGAVWIEVISAVGGV